MGKIDRPYSRVYWDAPDDEKFATVWHDDPALALWLRLLLAADASYPQPAHIPRGVKPRALERLVDAKLVDILPGDRFRIHGLQSERERRSEAARNAGLASGRARRGEGGDGGPGGEDPPLPEHPTNRRSSGAQRALNGPPTRTSTRTRGENEYEGELPSIPSLPPFDDGPDALDAWYRLTASAPSPKVTPWIERLCRDHGEAEVCSALAEAAGQDPDRSTLLSRTQNLLWERQHAATKAAERSRIEREAAERRAVEEMTPEQRRANMARLGEMMRGAGILPAGDRGSAGLSRIGPRGDA